MVPLNPLNLARSFLPRASRSVGTLTVSWLAKCTSVAADGVTSAWVVASFGCVDDNLTDEVLHLTRL